jgi:DNA-binding CsgD family transcriptional regulator
MKRCLPIEDVRGIAHLLGEVAAQPQDLASKRRCLLQGLAKLVRADIWVWLHHVETRSGTRPMAFLRVDGGWQSESQRIKVAEGTISPAAELLNARLRKGGAIHRTRRREDLFSEPRWHRSELAQKYFRPADIGEFLSSVYPLGDRKFSSIFFHRSLGRPAFTPREARIVHLVIGSVEKLHREGTDVPAAGHVNELSTRQRQVLIQLMTGDGVKQIASKLSLSVHTVTDHLKQIYRRFKVSGRGELFAQFLAGGLIFPANDGQAGD